MHEEFHLLFAFLFQRHKILIVFVTDIGDHTDRRTNDLLQLLHLSRLRDARLKNRQISLTVR